MVYISTLARLFHALSIFPQGGLCLVLRWCRFLLKYKLETTLVSEFFSLLVVAENAFVMIMQLIFFMKSIL